MGGNLAGVDWSTRAAAPIQAGELDVVVVCGGEAWRTRSRARAEGREPGLDASQPDDVPRARRASASTGRSLSDVERGAGRAPARRTSTRCSTWPCGPGCGLGIDEHRRRIGRLW